MAKINLNIDKSFFNEKYIPYLNRNETYQIFYGGSGSGKSVFLATKFVIDLLQSKTKLLVIMREYSGMKDKVFNELKTVLDKMKLINHGKKDIVKVTENPLHMTFPNGSEIIFKGADDEGKLLSISGIDMCWVEEATEITGEIFTQLTLRLRGGTKKKKYFLSFNPRTATSWIKKMFFDEKVEDTIIVHSTYKDNRFLLPDDVTRILNLQKTDPLKYEIFALGKWGALGKKIYTNWEVKEFKVHELIQANNNLKAVFGMDFGYISDPSTLICSLVDLEGRKLYIFDEMYEKGLLNNQIAEKVIEMGYAKETIIADSAEQKSIAEIKGYGISRIKPAKKGAGSIMTGIQYIQQFKIYVHPLCIHTIDELEQYAYKKDKATGLYINQPIDNHNHILDALRYSLEQFSKKAMLTSFNKKLLGL